MKTLKMAVLFSALAVSVPAFADDRPGHYEGEPAETLEQAVANFSEYNRRLETILGQGELSSRDLHEIHQITYTLENALERLEEEVEELAEVLEEVHLASENADAETVQSKGRDYLETSRQIIK
ncbi:hypothetical protein TspCOW1_13240 [Thiohalobacter sp. COW1]|uniref:Transposase and inactivated derivatives n=1 Tax=Thiohalobacter thiocyanaticus TaxID=585455 RepID=A0A1Z4VR61_9GAMM|nr:MULTISPECIES: DUF6746 family protein [Thiohalobacter]BAZ93694.1 transposase and inactivated derivatives [Thiohalobacter thiocyanaticus]BCO31221.1 hypothetical protein TspCOW1_13240 [Thiohalobacter sp. COW1]